MKSFFLKKDNWKNWVLSYAPKLWVGFWVPLLWYVLVDGWQLTPPVNSQHGVGRVTVDVTRHPSKQYFWDRTLSGLGLSSMLRVFCAPTAYPTLYWAFPRACWAELPQGRPPGPRAAAWETPTQYWRPMGVFCRVPKEKKRSNNGGLWASGGH